MVGRGLDDKVKDIGGRIQDSKVCCRFHRMSVRLEMVEQVDLSPFHNNIPEMKYHILIIFLTF